MDAGTRAARRAVYERWSSIPVFLLGSLFLVGLVEVVMDDGSSEAGAVLMSVTWLGFVVDLGITWLLDDDRRSFARRHWFAILAVLVPVFRALLVFYVFVRLARGRTRLQTRIQFYAAYLTILVITFGAVLVLHAERSYPGSNIQTYGEAVWWAAVTVTTVGYGDYVPVSPAGRLIATAMLFNGVAVISVITATISSRFVSNPSHGRAPVTLDDIDARLTRIEAALTAAAGQANAVPPEPAAADARSGSPADRGDRPGSGPGAADGAS
jgi:voltage-gated potassium channel